MKYLINRENFRLFDIKEINKLAPRAYFIPYSSKEQLSGQTVLTERYNSPLVKVLSGEWDFKYYEKDMLIPNEFYSERVQFDKVRVPSTWQRTGYREPCYINVRYEFDPTLYPEMPQDVPMGIYRKFVNIEDTEKVHIITFLGVISSLDLYVNGSFVGYSEGAHNSAEFDISKYLVKGKNEIIAVVSKWSTGTYLECQDMFRENGIFRDVYLSELPDAYVYDYQVDNEKADGKYSLTVTADITGSADGYSLTCELCDDGKTVAEETVSASGKTIVSFKNLDVNEWNAEEPYTYELYITLKKGGETVSVIRNITGFKTIEIKGNVFYFNGMPIKLKGVNHHDTNMKNGYALTAAQIEEELKLMKKLNINTIRTSHYPPDPALLTIADLLGFYIIDEADIETHGASECAKNAGEHFISNNLDWAPRYLDRVGRMYYRDRNHPCITMWSMGNEAGGYKCQDECCKLLKEKCPAIPVHYEGVIRTKRFAYDVVSEMYAAHEHVRKIGELKSEDKYKDKPYFMCEYSHAMGVGPGGVEEYWEQIYAHDNLMGGCVWEWADHAVFHSADDKYAFRYTYGGDHGEEKHDKNFCVDGMVYPDKTPHTGAYVIKAVYRPVRSSFISGKCFAFTNTNRFKNSKYLKTVWEQFINGRAVKSGELNLDIEPMQIKTFEIPYDSYSQNDDCYINISYYDGDCRMAREQMTLNDALTFSGDSGRVGNIETADTKGLLEVRFDDGKIVFNKKTGAVVSYMKNGCEFINQKPADGKKGFMPNLTRASLDNDVFGFPKLWDISKLRDAEMTLKNFKFSDSSAYATVAAAFAVSYKHLPYFRINTVYTIHGDGLVSVETTLRRSLFGPVEIQRFGLSAELGGEFKNIEFYGRGSDEKMENLCDLKDHTAVGYYKTTVAGMHEPYVMPQDNGNCGGVKYLKLSSEKGNSFNVYGDPKFSFSAHDYTQSSLEKAKHEEEIERADTTALCIDGFMRGTGTNTCGPDTLPQYKVKTEKKLTYKFSFKGE